MNKIVNYVNNLFYALPKSEENARLKSQILDSLQSKYQRYLEEGMSEDMAFGRVVSEFGNMEELMPNLANTEAVHGQPQQPSARLQEYMEAFQSNLIQYRITLIAGILFCIMGVFGAGIIEYFTQNEAVTILTFILPISIGVALIVGSQLKYSNLKQMILSLSRQENYRAYIEYFKDSDLIMAEDFYEKYRNQNSSSKHNYDYILAWKLSSVIMILATMTFLILGIIFNMWHPGWLAFPIGGMLCGIVNILLGKK